MQAVNSFAETHLLNPPSDFVEQPGFSSQRTCFGHAGKAKKDGGRGHPSEGDNGGLVQAVVQVVSSSEARRGCEPSGPEFSGLCKAFKASARPSVNEKPWRLSIMPSPVQRMSWKSTLNDLRAFMTSHGCI